jgi:hypothetical protein
MKRFVIASTVALLMTPAFAQTSTSSSPQSPQASQSSSNSGQSQNTAAAQKLKQTLESEGFTDVKVVAQSFVVQGKSPDGDPVLMTIGPHGMSVFEAMNTAGSGETTGSSSHSPAGTSNSNTPSAGPSTNSNSQTQK